MFGHRTPPLLYQRRLIAIKEILGPHWYYIERIPKRDKTMYCVELLIGYPRYLGQFNTNEEQFLRDVRAAMRQLEHFFRKGPFEGFPTTPEEKHESKPIDVPVIEESIDELEE